MPSLFFWSTKQRKITLESQELQYHLRELFTNPLPASLEKAVGHQIYSLGIHSWNTCLLFTKISVEGQLHLLLFDIASSLKPTISECGSLVSNALVHHIKNQANVAGAPLKLDLMEATEFEREAFSNLLQGATLETMQAVDETFQPMRVFNKPIGVSSIQPTSVERQEIVASMQPETSLSPGQVESTINKLLQNLQESMNLFLEITRESVQDKTMKDFLRFFRDISILTGKTPVDTAVDQITNIATQIQSILITYPDSLNVLPAYDKMPQGTTINNPPSTSMDILILFCHSPDTVFKWLKDSRIPEFSQLSAHLKIFQHQCMAPIRTTSTVELRPTIFDRKEVPISRLTARRLIPMITLVLGSHPQLNSDQVQTLNLAANTPNSYYAYSWDQSSLSPGYFDKAFQLQYDRIRFVNLVKKLHAFLRNYPHFFLKAKFCQDIIIKIMALPLERELFDVRHPINAISLILCQTFRECLQHTCAVFPLKMYTKDEQSSIASALSDLDEEFQFFRKPEFSITLNVEGSAASAVFRY